MKTQIEWDSLYVSPVANSSWARKREQARASRFWDGGLRSFFRPVYTRM